MIVYVIETTRFCDNAERPTTGYSCYASLEEALEILNRMIEDSTAFAAYYIRRGIRYSKEWVLMSYNLETQEKDVLLRMSSWNVVALK